MVLSLWGGEVGCSTRVDGEACPGPVKRYIQRLAPGLGGGPQGQHLVKKKKNVKKNRLCPSNKRIITNLSVICNIYYVACQVGMLSLSRTKKKEKQIAKKNRLNYR